MSARTLHWLPLVLATLAAGCGVSSEPGTSPAPSELDPASVGDIAVACPAAPHAPSLDHVVIAVRDLEAAVTNARAAGFTVKPGRVHGNGLLNAHLKLADSTEIELMSVPGPATDAIARGYAEYLREGEGGAFLALDAQPAAVVERARAAGVRAELLHDVYAVFPDLPHLFVVAASPPHDPPELLTHANGAIGLAEVSIEGDDELTTLLEALGARRCPNAPGDPAGTVRLGLAGGQVTIRPDEPGGRTRPSVLAATLRARPTDSTPTDPQAAPSILHGVRLRFESE